MEPIRVPPDARHERCTYCRTELAPHAVVCPACCTLVFAETLESLAASAEAARSPGNIEEARARWQDALRFLPPDSRQYTKSDERIADLTTRIDAANPPKPGAKPANLDHSAWRRALGGVATVFLLLLGELKFLILGLTKASTFFSMFAFFGAYSSTFGWPLAAGLVVSIYIHEMGTCPCSISSASARAHRRSFPASDAS